MKLAMITRFPLNTSAPRGGVESATLNLTDALASLNEIEIHVLTTNKNCKNIETKRWKNTTLHYLPWHGHSMLHHAIGPGKKLLEKYIKNLNADIIHAHDVYGLSVVDLDIPRVFTIHGFIYEDTKLSNRRFPNIRAKIWKHYEISSWKKQTNIISISPYVRERVSLLTNANIFDIDNPIQESFFNIERKEQKNQQRIFSAAWISERKNTLGLLKAFKKIIPSSPNAQLILAGEAKNKNYLNAVKNYIQTNNLSESVLLAGRLTQGQIRDELAKATIFALVSLEENSPMALEEAMAAELPIITSNRCGMPYMIKNNESGFLVEPANYDQIAEKCNLLLQNDELRREMGHKARQRATEKFHPKSVAKKTFNIYKLAIENHKK